MFVLDPCASVETVVHQATDAAIHSTQGTLF
ncbi:Uncharacterised protein [Burkholderia pseudomallei]|nr:Uncharacterised protein [Burkholderia pseudomallei]